MEQGPPIVYPDIRMELRAPRVAVVFRADDGWHDWARLALYTASQYWGGHGFVLVPHADGEVDPVVLRAVAAYDPDYVVRLGVTAAQHEALRPSMLRCTSDGDLLEGADRDAFLDRHNDAVIPDPPGDQARDVVVAACSSYRRWFDDGVRDENLTVITANGIGRPLTRIDDVDSGPSWPVLAAPPDWGGALGVAIAAKCGAVEPPVGGEAPELDDADELTLARWLLDAPAFGELPFALARHGDGPVMSVLPSTLRAGFARTTAGLTTITHRVGRRAPALAMIGDSPADFAVAMICDRTYGNGWWVPSALATTGAPDPLLKAAELLDDQILQHGASGRTLHVASRSVDDDRLAPVVEHFRETARVVTGGRRATTTVTAAPVEFPMGETQHFAVTNQWDDPISVAVRQDEQGGTTMVAAPPMPLITEPTLAGNPSLCWQVEVSLPHCSIPPGRGLGPESLVASDESVHLTWVRNGRHGICYESDRWDFVASGASLAGQLARPRLRQMGLLDWARAVTEQHERAWRLSDAGRRVETLRRLWGSREALSATIAGPMRAVLEEFKPASERSDDSYPDHDGVKLGDDGYLTLGRMTRVVSDDVDAAELRNQIDALASIGVVFRGLILRCGSCETVQFVKIDDAAQLNTCARCGVGSQLVQERWRHPHAEPTWFYDLHPAVRQLFEHHGDVPLLLSHHLRTKSRQFFDTAEFEITDPTSSLAAETDLLALSDGRVAVAEAKSIDTLGNGAARRKAVDKKLLLAETLHADEIILATTRPAWKKPTINALAAGIRQHTWPTARVPKLRVIARLGTSEPTDAYDAG